MTMDYNLILHPPVELDLGCFSCPTIVTGAAINTDVQAFLQQDFVDFRYSPEVMDSVIW